MPSNFPLHPDKHKLTPLLRAEDMIEFRRKHGNLGAVAVPRSAVLCLYKGVMHRVTWKYPSQKVSGFLGDLYLIKRTGGKVAVLGNFGIGAPAITSIGDELMAWGLERLVILSLAGGLQSELSSGSLVIGDRALRDEGTSYHYLPTARDVQASDGLVSAIEAGLAQRGLTAARGAVWSTDAPYRETREEAEAYGREGIKAVDMGSAGLFAAAQARGKQAASVFVIGDSLAGPRWSAPPDMRMLHQRLKSLLEALIATLSTLD